MIRSKVCAGGELRLADSYFIAANGAKAVEIQVPYTKGLWQQTPPVEVKLDKGRNVLHVELIAGTTVFKDFTLTPVK